MFLGRRCHRRRVDCWARADGAVEERMWRENDSMTRQPARGRIQVTHAERQPRRIRSDVYLSSPDDGPSFEVPTPASGSQANASTADNKQIKYDCLSNDRAHNSSVGSPPFDSSGHRMHRTHLEPVGLSISNRNCRIWGMQQHPTRRISPHLDADCCATAETATTATTTI